MIAFDTFDPPTKPHFGLKEIGMSSLHGVANLPLAALYPETIGAWAIPPALAVAGSTAYAITQKPGIMPSALAIAGSTIATTILTAAACGTYYNYQNAQQDTEYYELFTQQHSAGVPVEDMQFPTGSKAEKSHLSALMRIMGEQRNVKSDYDKAFEAYVEASFMNIGGDLSVLPPDEPSDEEKQQQPKLAPQWSAEDEAVFKRVGDAYRDAFGYYDPVTDERHFDEDYWPESPGYHIREDSAAHDGQVVASAPQMVLSGSIVA